MNQPKNPLLRKRKVFSSPQFVGRQCPVCKGELPGAYWNPAAPDSLQRELEGQMAEHFRASHPDQPVPTEEEEKAMFYRGLDRDKLRGFVDKWQPDKDVEHGREPGSQDEDFMKGMGIRWEASLAKQAMPLTPRGQQLFQMSGNEVIEEVDIGDYELYLTYSHPLGLYQMGMQRAGQDFTDEQQQAERVTPKLWGSFDRRAFKTTVQRWLSQYHLLLVASHNSAKTKLYGIALRALGFRPQRAAGGDIVYIADEQADMQVLERAAAYMEQARQRNRGPR